MDELDVNLARLKRAVDERELRRRAPAVEPLPPPAPSQEPPPSFTDSVRPYRREAEPQQSWTDMLRRLLGR